MRIAFAGNPNSGKTTMYNQLTGLSEGVGNWAGVTVGKKEAPLLKEFAGGKLHWTSFVLGIVIVGLEAGWIYAYKAGWQVSTGFIVQSAFLAASLLFVGYFLYHESLTWNKLLGVAICLVGLFFIKLR